MSNTTANQSPLIKAQVYSEFMLEQINDGFLPDGLHRDVSDFGDGDTLFIPTLGETVIRDYAENDPIKYDPVDSGQITLTITEYVSGGSYVTRKLQQDAYKAAALEASIAPGHLRKIQEKYETDLLAQALNQTADDPNLYNGFAHRWVADSGSAAGIITLTDFEYAKLSFDKANVPDEGRICIIDPVSEAHLNQQVGAEAFSNNPMFEGIVNTGFAQNKRFVRNIFGWDIWVSNRLPRVTETIDGGPHATSETVTDGINNIFMSVLDDQHKPFMGAWRQMPQVDGEFNKDLQRDEYVTTARWGFGLQRAETLISVLTRATY